jgi:hypothetical protein
MKHLARTKRVVAASLASGMAIAVLAGCGGSTDGGETPTPAATSATPTAPTDGMVGGDPATWAPVEVTAEMNGQTIDLVNGQAANFVGLPESDKGYFVVSSNDSVATAHSSMNDKTVPGFHGVGVGEATIVLYDGDPESAEGAAAILEVKAKVTDKTGTPAMDAETSESDDDTDM